MGRPQLPDGFNKRLPEGLGEKGKITRYVEPFIGGGAVFFYLTRKFSFKECCIGDANEELILTYRAIQQSVEKVISELRILESAFFTRDVVERQAFYYEIRDSFNDGLAGINFQRYSPGWAERAARIIFLNRTCFNGLFRVNRNGDSSVPSGRYTNPDILNEENLRDVAQVLENTRIIRGDFTRCRDHVDDHTFVYFDPPYRPISRTSSFTSYSKGFFRQGSAPARSTFQGTRHKRGKDHAQ